MYRFLIILCASFLFAVGASAQTQKLPPDLVGLPDEIKTLKWQTIDPASLDKLEHCRALLLLNHTLDELSSNATAEADLMSAYIEKQNLGTQFAGTAPPPAPRQLTYPEAEKVAVALLRGPLSNSYYATELGDVSAGALASYEQMYERTCQRRWSEFDESRHLARCMSSFLGNAQKLPDYEAWATAESARREQDYQQRTGAKPADSQAVQQLQQQLHQVQGALGVAEHQQQSLAQQTAQAQQQAAQAQQQAAQAQQQSGQQTQQPYPTGYVYPGGYGGYGVYPAYGTAGAAAAGAYAGANAAEANNAGAAAAGAAAAKHPRTMGHPPVLPPPASITVRILPGAEGRGTAARLGRKPKTACPVSTAPRPAAAEAAVVGNCSIESMN